MVSTTARIVRKRFDSAFMRQQFGRLSQITFPIARYLDVEFEGRMSTADAFTTLATYEKERNQVTAPNVLRLVLNLAPTFDWIT